MAAIRIFVIFFALFALTNAAPGFFGHKHEHHTIHVPYKVHTIHHHHVKKIHVPVHIVKEVPVVKEVIKEVHVPVYKEVHVPVHVHHEDHHDHHEDHHGWSSSGW